MEDLQYLRNHLGDVIVEAPQTVDQVTEEIVLTEELNYLRGYL